ncbi:MAG: Uma2 family endonuclease [Cyanobacteriota bacterium]|nr:Uma2 family endonuclease [Cyanobacteriota bacterium]
MSVELAQEQSPNLEERNEWIPPMPPTDLIFDDGEPLESNRHRIAINVAIESIHQAYGDRDDYFAGGNMFVYYSSKQVRDRDFKGPDFFVALEVDGTQERQGWVVWEEQGRYPDVIVEFMSPSTAAQDTGRKKTLYEGTFRTRDYFVYDPFNPASFQGWHLDEQGKYQEIKPNDRGWLWCEALGLWLGLWEGTIARETATWVRFYDRDGNLVPLGTEEAEQERDRAEQEHNRAEQERNRAEQERQEKEQALAALEEAQREQQRLRDRLTEMGIDPDRLQS